MPTIQWFIKIYRNTDFCEFVKARVLLPHFFLTKMLKSVTAFTDKLHYPGAVDLWELKLRRQLLCCPCMLATSSSCRPEFMLWACSVVSSACAVGGCGAALNADQRWWCHTLWCHTRWGMDRGVRQWGRTDKEITHVLSRCSQNRTESSTSFNSE